MTSKHVNFGHECFNMMQKNVVRALVVSLKTLSPTGCYSFSEK